MGKILVSEQLSVFKPQVWHPALVDGLRPGFPGLAAGPLPMLFSRPTPVLLSGICLPGLLPPVHSELDADLREAFRSVYTK